MWRGVPAKSTLPLLQHWSVDTLKARVKQEGATYALMKGKYGIGVWDFQTYPVSLGKSKVKYRRNAQIASWESPPERTLTIKIPEDLMTNSELELKYPDPVLRAWMSCKRNLEIVSRMHSRYAIELEAKLENKSVVNPVDEEVVDGIPTPV